MKALSSPTLLIFALALVSTLLTACDSDSAGSSTDMAWCQSYAVTICEKAVACEDTVFMAVYEIESVEDCSSAAVAFCAALEEEDDDCTPKPSDASLTACKNQIDSTACSDYSEMLKTQSCATLQEELSCDEELEDTSSELETTADQQQSDTLTDQQQIDIQIEGCVAAALATCEAVSSCAGSYPALPERVLEGISNCDTILSSNSEEIAQLCQTYLEESVPQGYELAVYLNESSASEVTTCIDSVNCDRAFVIEVIEALLDLSEGGQVSSLTALLTPMVSACL